MNIRIEPATHAAISLLDFVVRLFAATTVLVVVLLAACVQSSAAATPAGHQLATAPTVAFTAMPERSVVPRIDRQGDTLRAYDPAATHDADEACGLSGPTLDAPATNTGSAGIGVADDVPLHSPSFIAHPNGEIVSVPRGAVGPTTAESGRGFQFTGGSGGHGLDPRVTDIRVMEPVVGGKYPYPNGYVSYSNGLGQTVNPYSGRTVSATDPWWHWPWS